jgi:hypothetical protein
MKRRHFPCEVPAPVPKALGVTPPWKFVRHPILGATPPARGALTEGPAPLPALTTLARLAPTVV